MNYPSLEIHSAHDLTTIVRIDFKFHNGFDALLSLHENVSNFHLAKQTCFSSVHGCGYMGWNNLSSTRNPTHRCENVTLHFRNWNLLNMCGR